MTTLNLQRFTRVETLRAIKQELLAEFLQPYNYFFQSRGVSLSPQEDSGELDCKGLVNVFMHPDADTPDGLADALYYIHEMATTDGMDQLMEEAEKSAIRIAYHPGSTPEDIAIQVWLADREIVERKHAEQFLSRPKSFEYYQSANEPTSIGKLKNDTLRGIEKNLDDWFEKKKRGRTSRVFAFPRGAETWFLVRHGEPYKREGSIKDGDVQQCFLSARDI